MKYARTATFPAVLLKLLMAFMRFAAVSDMWLEQLQFSVLDAMTFESILLAFMIFGKRVKALVLED